MSKDRFKKASEIFGQIEELRVMKTVLDMGCVIGGYKIPKDLAMDISKDIDKYIRKLDEEFAKL